MRIPEYSVTHSRSGWGLHLSHTSLTRLVLTNLVERVPARLVARFAWAYRPWNWALCKLDGKTVSHVSLSAIDARVLAPEFYAEVTELFGNDLEPDGSLRRDLWK